MTDQANPLPKLTLGGPLPLGGYPEVAAIGPTSHRADIDGLRAIAVLIVLMFHLELGVPGGYIGVDVFFVISGFLIAGIIKRELDQGTFKIAQFYARRARRILPALLVVLAFSSVAAIFILLPSDLDRYARSVLASLLSLSNFWFWSQGGYFGTTSEMAPLLHTWTLAVEEQFYVLLPVALALSYRWYPRRTSVFLFVGCVVTFAASAWFISTRTPEVFYFSPFRAWELLLGSLLAWFRIPFPKGRFFREVIAAIGLSLIVVPAFAYTSETLFPGPAAALPCFGAVLIIWIGNSGKTLIGSLLRHRLAVFIGLISYSLYLWHWPLLVFTKHFMGEDLALGMRLGIGALSVALATTSWRLIEIPFRSSERTSLREMLALSGVSAALLCSMVFAVIFNEGLQGRFSPEVAALDRARARSVERSECINLRGRLSADSVCRIGASGTASIFVWGDSYSHAMLPAFDAAFTHMGIAAWFAAESGCPPLPSTHVSYRGRDNWRCREFNDKVMSFLGSQSGVSQVVLAAAWDGYATESSGYKLRGGGDDDSVGALKKGVADLARELRATNANRQLIVVGQVPTHAWSVPQKMLRQYLRDEPIAPLKREAWGEKSAASQNVFMHLADSRQIAFVNSADWFCSTGVCIYADEKGLPLYWDEGHVNANGALFIAPMLEQSLRPLIQRPSRVGTP